MLTKRERIRRSRQRVRRARRSNNSDLWMIVVLLLAIFMVSLTGEGNAGLDCSQIGGLAAAAFFAIWATFSRGAPPLVRGRR